MNVAGHLRAWLRLPPSRSAALTQARLVVVDVETTGLRIKRDLLLSIGAVAVEGLRIDLGQQFERTIRNDTSRALDNILIHGLAPSAILSGEEPRQVLTEFARFVGDSPLLAFHADFDRQVLQRAYRRHLGTRLHNPFLDIAELAPALVPERQPRLDQLDAWLDVFGLSVSNRHNAAADAFATAELLLVLLQAAVRQGMRDVNDLRRRIDLDRQRRLARDSGV